MNRASRNGWGSRRGFTAVELAVATLVVILVAAAAMWAMRDRITVLRGEQLRAAAEADDWRRVLRLLKRGAPPDAYSGSTPHYCLLCTAAGKGQLDVINEILASTPRDKLRHSRLHISGYYIANGGHDPAVFDAILGTDVDINLRHLEFGGTLLHVAAGYGRTESAKLLLDRGASPVVTNSQALTPGGVAWRQNHADLARLLREAEADWRARQKATSPSDAVVPAVGRTE